MMFRATIGELMELLPTRPKHLQLTSLAALYDDFDRLFLGGSSAAECIFQSACGIRAQAFDHNCFHFVNFSILPSVGSRRFSTSL